MADEVATLKKELAMARAEIEELNLRLHNAVFMLKREMSTSKMLPQRVPVQADDQFSSR